MMITYDAPLIEVCPDYLGGRFNVQGLEPGWAQDAPVSNQGLLDVVRTRRGVIARRWRYAPTERKIWTMGQCAVKVRYWSPETRLPKGQDRKVQRTRRYEVQGIKEYFQSPMWPDHERILAKAFLAPDVLHRNWLGWLLEGWRDGWPVMQTVVTADPRGALATHQRRLLGDREPGPEDPRLSLKMRYWSQVTRRAL